MFYRVQKSSCVFKLCSLVRWSHSTDHQEDSMAPPSNARNITSWIVQRRREYFHWTNGSTSSDSSVPRGYDRIRVPCCYDGWFCNYCWIRVGYLYSLWCVSASSCFRYRYLVHRFYFPLKPAVDLWIRFCLLFLEFNFFGLNLKLNFSLTSIELERVTHDMDHTVLPI